MTTQTRTRVIVGAIALLLTLPTESILLKALSTPGPKEAAQQFVRSLAPAQLSAAAGSIQAYPFAYRKAIMAALPPAVQAHVWQNHIASYIAANPGLGAEATSALNDALALVSADVLAAPPTDDERAQIHAVATHLTAALGKDTALDLLYRLGPADGTFASVEPVSDKIADFVRRTFVLNAESVSCDCNTGFGCTSGGGSCGSATGCSVVTDWPACGWLWRDPCDGSCQAGLGSAGD